MVFNEKTMAVQEKAALEEQCAQLRLQAQAGVGQAALGEPHTDAAAQAGLLEQRTGELQAAEQRRQDAAAEVQTLLATVARHKDEVAMSLSPQIALNTDPFMGSTCQRGAS